MSFRKSQWIWLEEQARPDEWANFYDELEYEGGKLVVRVCADSSYALYVNGRLALFGKYADYPNRRFYEEKEISELLRPGRNALCFLVWYFGESSSTYCQGPACLIYEAEDQSGRLAAYSGAHTLSRLAPDYCSHRGEKITGQLGYGFRCDGTAYDGYRDAGYRPGSEWRQSRLLDLPVCLERRPIALLELKERCPSVPVMQGAFRLAESERTSVRLHRAMQSFLPYAEMADRPAGEFGRASTRYSVKEGDGLYLVLDMGREEAGYLDLELNVPEDADVLVTYGEHLLDGRVRGEIENRNFLISYRARRGENRFFSPLRRLGLRYLQVYICCRTAEVGYAGIRPCEYPLAPVPFDCKNLLRQTVYEVSLRTMQLCMHEHYEDCPWREQALYTMDSRNQMLFGYYGFREFAFPRASLLLMPAGQRADGLLELCFPAEVPVTIPYFSLIYAVQLCEYMEYSGDKSILPDTFGTVKRINEWFEARIRDGLIRNDDRKEIWNFYEWRDPLCGYYAKHETDVLIQAFYAISLRSAAKLADWSGEAGLAGEYRSRADSVSQAAAGAFWDPEERAYRSFTDEAAFSQLANALCILSGICPQEEREQLAARLSAESGWIPATLSMMPFVYDALLMTDRARYAPYVIDRLDRVYLEMLRHGATSFWETELGAADFGDAGSLCHGWSAAPVYYYQLLKEYL